MILKRSPALTATCRNCKWWHDRHDPHEPEGYRACRHTHSKKGSPVIPNSLAYASDAEFCFAILITHESFFCAMFEPKEK